MLKRKISVLFFMSLFCSCVLQTSANAKYLSTKYQHYSLPTGIMCSQTRERVKTYSEGKEITKGYKSVLGSVTNTKKKKCKMTGTYTKTRSRSYSVGGNIELPILENAVNLTIGGSLSFSESITLSATVTVPKKSTYTFYYRVNTRKDKYKHLVQKQRSSVTGKWNSYGSQFTRYSTITTKTPEIIV